MEGRGFSLVGSVDMCSVQGANQRSPDCEYRQGLCLLSWDVPIRVVKPLGADGIFGCEDQWILGSLGRLETSPERRYYGVHKNGEAFGHWSQTIGQSEYKVCRMPAVVYNYKKRGTRLGEQLKKELGQ
jgi:hypothetical protein